MHDCSAAGPGNDDSDSRGEFLYVGPCSPADVTRTCGAPRSLIVAVGGDGNAGPDAAFAWLLDPEAITAGAWAPLPSPGGRWSPTAASGLAGPGAVRGVLAAGDCVTWTGTRAARVLVPGSDGGAASFEWRATRGAPEALQFACAVEERRTGRAIVLGSSGCALEYDAGADAWLELAPRPTECESAAVAELEGRVVAIGSGGHGHALGSVAEAYDPREGSWQHLGKLRGSRECVEECACGGALYAVGGIDRDRELAEASRYDPRAGRWEELAPMLGPKYGLACAEVAGSLWTFGGLRDEKFLAESERYDPSVGAWVASSASALPSPRGCFGLAWL
eukprot:m51a1_g3590 putative kelch-like protein 20 (335) ;mRNA; f:1162460-1163464